MKAGLLMRVIHRYLGFFLVGIMAMYAISGIILVFRDTNFLKQDKVVEKALEPNLQPEALGKKLKKKNFKVTKQEGDLIHFKNGTYNRTTGEAAYTVKELPLILDKMTKFHKANSSHPLFWLNVFFGISLFYFVISTFWMFRPKTQIFRKGIYFTIGGIVLMILLLLV